MMVTRMRATPLPIVATALALTLALGACDGARDILVPTVYLVAGRVADPTSSPFTALPGATVSVETAPQVASVTTDADGNFVLHGVPAGTHRLRATLAGRVPAISIGLVVTGNVDDTGLPLFTRAEIDSILLARGAPAWDTSRALVGLFALRSNDVPLGAATISLSPSAPYAGGTLFQTGDGADPIVIDNAIPGSYSLTVQHPGYVWDGPYAAELQAGVVTFGLPRARPNLNGFVFAERSTGNAVDGAQVTILSGPMASQSTSDFLGQFSLVGMIKGVYTVGASAAGFLPGVSWPQDLQADTTLTFLVARSDSLTAWSAAVGGPALDPSRGHLLVEARDVVGGVVIAGATLVANPSGGFAVAQTSERPALLLNLLPGTYTVSVTGGAVSGTPAHAGVLVRAGEVTASRLDLATGSSP